MNQNDVMTIAQVCHEANRVYCKSIGDNTQPLWSDAPQWQKDSAISGVEFHLNNDVTPEQSHENWLREKVTDGWVYGEVKNPDKKEHPCMVPYCDLPAEQQIKDLLFKTIVDCFKEATP